MSPQLKSFAYLKDNAYLKNKKPAAVAPAAVDFATKPTIITKPITRTDSLMGSKYCYGCINFSVSAPETKIEMGWCQQYDDDDKIIFKRIKEDITVSKCPGRVEG